MTMQNCNCARDVSVNVFMASKHLRTNAPTVGCGRRINLTMVRPCYTQHDNPEAARLVRHNALEESLQACMLQLLTLVGEKKEHIPPVVSSDVVCFPYEITLPSESDSHFGLDMFKRVVLNSSPPAMLS